jgi:hypothetical protein
VPAKTDQFSERKLDLLIHRLPAVNEAALSG